MEKSHKSISFLLCVSTITLFERNKIREKELYMHKEKRKGKKKKKKGRHINMILPVCDVGFLDSN
jgi:myosin-crossreactive antigen